MRKRKKQKKLKVQKKKKVEEKIYFIYLPNFGAAHFTLRVTLGGVQLKPQKPYKNAVKLKGRERKQKRKNVYGSGFQYFSQLKYIFTVTSFFKVAPYYSFYNLCYLIIEVINHVIFFHFYTKKSIKGFQSPINVDIAFSFIKEANLSISAKLVNFVNHFSIVGGAESLHLCVNNNRAAIITYQNNIPHLFSSCLSILLKKNVLAKFAQPKLK